MPKSKSVEKATRASERKRLHNKSVRSVTRTRAVQAESLIRSNEMESAESAVLTAVSTFDRAAKKGVMHPNTAARRKSRLMKKLNRAKLSNAGESTAAGSNISEE